MLSVSTRVPSSGPPSISGGRTPLSRAASSAMLSPTGGESSLTTPRRFGWDAATCSPSGRSATLSFELVTEIEKSCDNLDVELGALQGLTAEVNAIVEAKDAANSCGHPLGSPETKTSCTGRLSANSTSAMALPESSTDHRRGFRPRPSRHLAGCDPVSVLLRDLREATHRVSVAKANALNFIRRLEQSNGTFHDPDLSVGRQASFRNTVKIVLEENCNLCVDLQALGFRAFSLLVPISQGGGIQ
eukprot:TRINITY_DN56749_c0_g1_i1.p1 TRINITY_DN56749_c0_g1~~TRINITY_DN56749_c0_g1_i1.p1  ORF type:complete len:245 (-),score=17.06 TRINITY_DN56749_c0_g1_i1:162-896(-)